MSRVALVLLLPFILSACASTPKHAETALAADEAPAEAAPADAAPAEEAPAALSAKNFNLADIPFAAFDPDKPEGLHVYPLTGNPKEGPFNAIVRMPPGFMSPLHSHSANYTGVAMSDSMVHGTSAGAKETVARGSYWHQVAGEPHVDGCMSEEPCYLLAFFDGAVDMVPADAPAAEPTVHVTPGDQVKWEEVKGGVQMAVIHGNPKEGSFHALFQFPAGMTTNLHTHSSSFAGALVSGSHERGAAADQLVALSPGGVWSEPAGSAHMEKCGADSPCLFAVAMDGALNTEAVELTPAADAAPAAEAAPATE